MIQTKRAYEPAAGGDDARFLLERLTEAETLEECSTAKEELEKIESDV